MQHYFSRFIIVCAFLIAVSGCKKEKLDPLTSSGYVQFKIDGSERRFDDYDQRTGDITLSTSPTSFNANFNTSLSPISNRQLTFQFKSDKPLEAKTYTLNSKNKADVLFFLETETDLTNYVYVTTLPKGAQYPSYGTLELTRVDTAAGGRIEGKFSFNNLYLRDGNLKVLNYYRNVSEGSFSLPVK